MSSKELSTQEKLDKMLSVFNIFDNPGAATPFMMAEDTEYISHESVIEGLSGLGHTKNDRIENLFENLRRCTNIVNITHDGSSTQNSPCIRREYLWHEATQQFLLVGIWNIVQVEGNEMLVALRKLYSMRLDESKYHEERKSKKSRYKKPASLVFAADGS